MKIFRFYKLVYPLFTILFYSKCFSQTFDFSKDQLKRVKSSSVLIQTFFNNNFSTSPNIGGGIIFFEQNDSLYIITAAHLFRLPDLPKEYFDHFSITFDKLDVPINGNDILRLNKKLDFAIIRIKKPSTDFYWDRRYTSFGLKNHSYIAKKEKKVASINDDVRLVVGRGEWLNENIDQDGKVTSEVGNYYHINFKNLNIDIGFSGGPVFSKRGFIGIVLQPVTYGSSETNVLSANVIYRQIDKFFEEVLEPNEKFPRFYFGLNFNYKIPNGANDNKRGNKIAIDDDDISLPTTILSYQNNIKNISGIIDCELFKNFYFTIQFEYYRLRFNNLRLIEKVRDTRFLGIKTGTIYSTQNLLSYKNRLYQFGANLSYNIGDSDKSTIMIGFLFANHFPEIRLDENGEFHPLDKVLNDFSKKDRNTKGFMVGLGDTILDETVIPTKKVGTYGVRFNLLFSDYIDSLKEYDPDLFISIDLFFQYNLTSLTKWNKKKIKGKF